MKEKNTTAPERNEEGAIPFKGYTMEELKYQRAMMALRKEYCKAKVMKSVQDLLPDKNASKRKSVTGAKRKTIVGQLASKVFNNLNTIDYILMGISIFGTVRKGYKLIRGKK